MIKKKNDADNNTSEPFWVSNFLNLNIRDTFTIKSFEYYY